MATSKNALDLESWRNGKSPYSKLFFETSEFDMADLNRDAESSNALIEGQGSTDPPSAGQSIIESMNIAQWDAMFSRARYIYELMPHIEFEKLLMLPKALKRSNLITESEMSEVQNAEFKNKKADIKPILETLAEKGCEYRSTEPNEDAWLGNVHEPFLDLVVTLANSRLSSNGAGAHLTVENVTMVICASKWITYQGPSQELRTGLPDLPVRKLDLLFRMNIPRECKLILARNWNPRDPTSMSLSCFDTSPTETFPAIFFALKSTAARSPKGQLKAIAYAQYNWMSAILQECELEEKQAYTIPLLAGQDDTISLIVAHATYLTTGDLETVHFSHFHPFRTLHCTHDVEKLITMIVNIASWTKNVQLPWLTKMLRRYDERKKRKANPKPAVHVKRKHGEAF